MTVKNKKRSGGGGVNIFRPSLLLPPKAACISKSDMVEKTIARFVTLTRPNKTPALQVIA